MATWQPCVKQKRLSYELQQSLESRFYTEASIILDKTSTDFLKDLVDIHWAEDEAKEIINAIMEYGAVKIEFD